MSNTEDLAAGMRVQGILPDVTVTIVSAQARGTTAIEIVYKDVAGTLGQQLVFRSQLGRLRVLPPERAWPLDGDGALFRLVAEAHRIKLAYLFDPLMAVHTSQIEPLPHQITAVYQEMLTRLPLRYVLADDPGAGKTIMTGLFIKELLLRGDLRRCLIVAPGSLAEQWQDELHQKFDLPFDILTNDRLEAARTGNAFAEASLLIARLDKLARDDDAQAKLLATEWDLIVVDEAHKLAASFYNTGNEIKYTKRYQLGQELGKITRHFLLLTATPHNGKEEDFQLFMALLDPDRFAGKFRDGVHAVDTSDLMRRLLKEKLLKFDGTPLFPERLVETKGYRLSPLEHDLYEAVTTYVRDEFNRADALENAGRKGTVGFALTIVQRRLASSPEAIYQSLRRRRERLEKRLRDQHEGTSLLALDHDVPQFTAEDLADLDEQDPDIEQTEETVMDQATAARTRAELAAEIQVLTRLEAQAQHVRHSGTDCKWEELAELLQSPAMFMPGGARRKLVIFTEHRDTLNYLADRIRTLLGRAEAVVTIHGGLRREERRRIQGEFTENPLVEILIATDAAGEGINLQKAHLMINYDLPWNPNRLEQRFGRIHRIGQTEVCHLWNLVALDTREGEVYEVLLHKLDEARVALGGQVFDILSKVTFDDVPLRDLLVRAIRYGQQPEVRARMQQVVEGALDQDALRHLLDERALATETLDAARVQTIRAEMERAQARRLQPHFIADFCIAALRHLGGTIREREPHRYEITHVPAVLREMGRVSGEPILTRYARVAFDKAVLHVAGKLSATFIAPGHPLLDGVVRLILEQHSDLLRRGALLMDEQDTGTQPRALFMLEHAIQDARQDATGQRRVVARQMQFVELAPDGVPCLAGAAPYLDYAPLSDDDRALVAPLLDDPWLAQPLGDAALNFAIADLVPAHFQEVAARREALVQKTILAVNERLTQEIHYWDRRAEYLRDREQRGKVNAKQNAANAQRTADDLEARRTERLAELEQERSLAPLPPVMLGGALIIPAGLLAQLRGTAAPDAAHAHETARIERLAMQAVIRRELELKCVPRDVSAAKCGYDIESSDPIGGHLRFIEVKGRVAAATSVTVTKNEILTALNKPDQWILAVVLIEGDAAIVQYYRRPFIHEPDFAAVSITFDLAKLAEIAIACDA
jgi:SNF2 family DNA or RNA helicase